MMLCDYVLITICLINKKANKKHINKKHLKVLNSLI